MNQPSTQPAERRRFYEWLDDHINPLLVRSLRQEMRSKVFVVIYLLTLLTAALTASLIAWWPADSQGNLLNGEPLFVVLSIAWSLVAWTVVPIAMAQAMVREASEDSWQLLELTGMRPRRVLSGYVQSALVRGLWFGLCLLPFLAVAYLLRGVDISLILIAVILIPGGSTIAAAWATCIVSFSFAAHKMRFVFLGLVSLTAAACGLGSIYLWIEGIPSFFADIQRHAESAEIIIMIAVLFNMFVVALIIPMVLASAQLKHQAENRSSGPRLLALGLCLNAILLPIAIGLLGSWLYERSAIYEVIVEGMPVMAVPMLFVIIILAIFACTEKRTLSRRQLRSLSGGWLRRFTMWALGPGHRRGIRCTLLLVSLVSLAMLLVLWVHPYAPYSRQQQRLWAYAVILICGLVLLWLQAGLLFARCFNFPSGKQRLSLCGALIVWLLLPLFLAGLLNGGRLEGPVYWWSPLGGVYTMVKEFSTHRSSASLYSLLAQIALSLAAGISLMVQAGWLSFIVDFKKEESLKDG